MIFCFGIENFVLAGFNFSFFSARPQYILKDIIN